MTDEESSPPPAGPAPASGRERPRRERRHQRESRPAAETAAAIGVFDPPIWHPEDYGPLLTGPHAEKVASSAIAPLVAITRGLIEITDANLKEYTRIMGWASRRGQQYERFRNAAESTGVMAMPWYRFDETVQANRNSRSAEPAMWQYRPVNAELDDDGRERKYEMVGGQSTVIGAHPCTPASWIDPQHGDEQVPIMIAEGMLKADAALTGLLLASGRSMNELGVVGEDGTYVQPLSELRSRLYRMLTEVPSRHKVAILSISGVHNYHSHPEWNSVTKGREWWLGIDGDVATNSKVWKAANQLRNYLRSNKRASAVKLLSPTNTRRADEVEKLGIDDYLRHWGDWESLLDWLSDEFPDQPPKDDSERVGEWRVSDDGTFTEECVPLLDASGKPTNNVIWESRITLGGRLASFTRTRGASEEEVRTGKLNPTIGAAKKEGCEVEISWIDDGDEKKTAAITGPADMLDALPDRWYTFEDVVIPTELRALPQWPPSGPDARKWISAIKANTPERRSQRVAWEHMGWVPVDSTGREIPALIIGDQVICDDAVRPQVLVDPRLVDAIGQGDQFGISDVPESIGTFGDPEFDAWAADRIGQVLDSFIVNRPWTDPGVGALVVALGLRPLLPMRSRVTAFFNGPPNAGKTYTAKQVLSFLARNPGYWEENVPGTASSTLASTQIALSKAITWLHDDLAPSPSDTKAKGEEAAVGELVRSVFGGQARSRADKNMNMRAPLNPRCPLMITAENPALIGSVQERVINVDISPGALSADSAPLDQLKETVLDGIPADVSAVVVDWIRHQARQVGWSTYTASLDAERAALLSDARDVLSVMVDKKETDRPGKLASDLTIVLRLLLDICREVGIDKRYRDLLKSSTLTAALTRLCGKSFSSATESRPGVSLLRALRAGLSAGYFTVEDCNVDNRVPDRDGWPTLATDLGWRPDPMGDYRAGGPIIGYLYAPRSGDLGVVFNPHVAFAEARRRFPDLIHHGQKSRGTWGALRAAGFADTHWSQMDGTVSSRISRSAIGKGGKDTGVPVLLRTLLMGDEPATDREESD